MSRMKLGGPGTSASTGQGHSGQCVGVSSGFKVTDVNQTVVGIRALNNGWSLGARGRQRQTFLY